MQLWNTNQDMKTALSGIAEITDSGIKVTDESRLRNLAETLAYNAVFNRDENRKEAARWLIWEASIAFGCPAASIHNLYMARAENVYQDMTVPAINIRGLTFDVAKTIFNTLMKHKTRASIFEIARSEIDYTGQRPAEYAASVLAAAIASGYRGPVFLQGDHFQISLKRWKADPTAEVNAVKALIKEALSAGFYNIDIDTSTLVDLSQPNVNEEQRNNFETTAELMKTVRDNEPKGTTVSIGGEIGEVGGKNSTAEELIAYYKGVKEKSAGLTGLSKISIQTGTSHGGVPLPDGTIAKVKLDFGCLEKLGEVSRKQFRIGGVVQHGASTLPEEAFDHFPKTQTIEVHLATGFQNIIYDSKKFPADLRSEIYRWIDDNCAGERKEGETDEQFYYKTRKKGFGPFKEKLWGLPRGTRNAIMAELAETFDMLFAKLGITGRGGLVDKYIRPSPPHKTRPAAL